MTIDIEDAPSDWRKAFTNHDSKIGRRFLCPLLILYLCGAGLGCHPQNHRPNQNTTPRPSPPLASAPPPLPPADNGVVLWEVRKGDVISVMYEMHHVREATVTIRGDLQYMNSSIHFPCTVPISQRKGVVVTFTPKDSKLPWHYAWSAHWKIGQHIWIKPKPYLYSLPFRGRFPVIQGPFGTYSHGPGSQDEEAFDFGTPLGTPICAARSGTVIAFRSDMDAGGTNLKWQQRSNYIIIKHDDGTYAEYSHLRHQGVRVGLGDSVREGQVIGFSGATGHAAGPHLHFAVFHTLNGYTRETLPITFHVDPR